MADCFRDGDAARSMALAMTEAMSLLLADADAPIEQQQTLEDDLMVTLAVALEEHPEMAPEAAGQSNEIVATALSDDPPPAAGQPTRETASPPKSTRRRGSKGKQVSKERRPRTERGEAVEAELLGDAWGRLVLESEDPPQPPRAVVEYLAPEVSMLRGSEHLIGRSKSCKTRLGAGPDGHAASSKISGQHAALYVMKGEALIEDRSRYGTYLNRELIGKGNSAHVKHGDRISLLAGVAGTRDGITFRFELLDHDEMLRISIKSPSTKSYRAGSSVHVDLSESWAVIEPHDTDLGVE